MRRRSLIVAGSLLLAACGGGSALETSVPTTVGPTPSSTATMPTSTLPASSTTVAPTVRPPDGTLWLGISIHVEGWMDEANTEAAYDRHRTSLTELAQIAATHGAVLTFELSQVFMDAHESWGDTFVSDMTALGHGFGVHADAGGDNPPYRVFVEEIAAMRSQLTGMGVDVVHVSGICSASPWVEAAIEAGYLATTGAVEYCLTSLDPANLPADKQHVLDCAGPGDCHGSSVEDLAKRAHPWRTSDSSDWLRPDPAGGLWVLIGESGSALDCLGETATGPGCVADQADIDLFLSRLDQYLALSPQRVQPILSISWSIGSLPGAEFAEAFFSAIDPYVGNGAVVWHGIDDMARSLSDS